MLKYLMGRRLVYHSKHHDLNGHQIYGSRKGHTIYNILTTVQVIYNMARIQRDYLILMFKDLKGCHDCVRLALITITTQQRIFPNNPTLCFAKALRFMDNHIRTSFGISSELISWYPNDNPRRLGQGSGSACPR